MQEYKAELVNIDTLKPHPRNYQQHPDDELEHIAASIRVNGIYKNVVATQDGTILAGHGVLLAARKVGLEQVPVIKLDISPTSPQAMKILAGDNEIRHLAEVDDRALTEILKEIKDVDLDGLLGTGFDEMMLANLVMVTRPASEIEDIDEAAQWVGLPDYDPGDERLKIVVSFRDEADRAAFAQVLGLQLTENQKSTWWPPKQREDLSSLRFTEGSE